MKRIGNYAAILSGIFTCLVCVAATVPDSNIVQRVQSDFLQIQRPFNFTVNVSSQIVTGPAGIFGKLTSGQETYEQFSTITLRSNTLAFASKYGVTNVVYCLYPYLSDTNNDAEACIVIQGVLGQRMCIVDTNGLPFTTFQSRTDTGNWIRLRDDIIGLTSSMIEDTWGPMTGLYGEMRINGHCMLSTNAILPLSPDLQ